MMDERQYVYEVQNCYTVDRIKSKPLLLLTEAMFQYPVWKALF